MPLTLDSTRGTLRSSFHYKWRVDITRARPVTSDIASPLYRCTFRLQNKNLDDPLCTPLRKHHVFYYAHSCSATQAFAMEAAPTMDPSMSAQSSLEHAGPDELSCIASPPKRTDGSIGGPESFLPRTVMQHQSHGDTEAGCLKSLAVESLTAIDGFAVFGNGVTDFQTTASSWHCPRHR